MTVEKELLRGIALLKDGRKEGFDIFYAHTYHYVYTCAKVIMRNEEDALDLTQETFVQAYKGIRQLENANNVYAWLGSITYRQGMKIFRKRKKISLGEYAAELLEDMEKQETEYDPEVLFDEKVTADIIKSMIDELPELQRAAVLAYYYDGMKMDEIAEVFECSVNTIKSRLNYAKKYLRTKMKKFEKENRYRMHTLIQILFVSAVCFLLQRKIYQRCRDTLSHEILNV